jgi:hypothetical protein
VLPAFSICGTPKVPEHEASKIRRRMRRHDRQGTAGAGRGKLMAIYWFELVTGPVPDLEAAAERLYAITDDGQLAGDDHGGSVMFSREASSAIDAILSAIDDAQRAGLDIRAVDSDLVTAEDIAEKTGRSVSAVGHWITGERGRGGFPQPVIGRSSKLRLWSWADVSAWLSAAKLGGIDLCAVEVATAAAEVDVLLKAREVLRNAPEAYREGMARLVDA